MKKWILTALMTTVKKSYPEYSEKKLAEIKYGLEGIYLTITKIVVILLLSILLGILKESLLIMVVFNGIRFFAFGIHASKSSYCWIASILSFIVGPIIVKYCFIPKVFQLSIMFVSFILLLLYAPADTKKRPLINEKKRMRNKILSSIVCLIYSVLVMLSEQIISNSIVIGTIFGVLSVVPITYSIFHLPYNNYKSYVSNKTMA